MLKPSKLFSIQRTEGLNYRLTRTFGEESLIASFLKKDLLGSIASDGKSLGENLIIFFSTKNLFLYAITFFLLTLICLY